MFCARSTALLNQTTTTTPPACREKTRLIGAKQQKSHLAELFDVSLGRILELFAPSSRTTSYVAHAHHVGLPGEDVDFYRLIGVGMFVVRIRKNLGDGFCEGKMGDAKKGEKNSKLGHVGGELEGMNRLKCWRVGVLNQVGSQSHHSSIPILLYSNVRGNSDHFFPQAS